MLTIIPFASQCHESLLAESSLSFENSESELIHLYLNHKSYQLMKDCLLNKHRFTTDLLIYLQVRMTRHEAAKSFELPKTKAKCHVQVLLLYYWLKRLQLKTLAIFLIVRGNPL